MTKLTHAVAVAVALALALLPACAATPTEGGKAGDDAEAKTLTVVTNPGYVPFEFREKGETGPTLMGLDVDLAKEIAKAAGRELEWKEEPFDEVLEDVAEGESDLAISGISITEERKKRVDFSEPYTEVGKALLFPTTHKGKVSLAPPPDFIVATVKGTTSADAVAKAFPKAKVKLFGTEAEAVAAVVNGQEADAMLFDAPFVRAEAKRSGGRLRAEDVAQLPKEPIGVAVRKGDTALLKIVNDTIARLKADGTLAKLEKMWLVDMDWKSRVPVR